MVKCDRCGKILKGKDLVFETMWGKTICEECQNYLLRKNLGLE